MRKEIFLEQDVPLFKGKFRLEEGVYYAKIVDVTPINKDRIKVKFNLTLDDDSIYTLNLWTNLTPKHSWDMINRLVNECRTRRLKEFIGCELYVSVVISEPSSLERYENIQDVMFSDDEEFEYELSEKGYFLR